MRLILRLALCHRNVHIDQCWFRRGKTGELECGYLDWGRVGQMPSEPVLRGAFSAAHRDIRDLHLDASGPRDPMFDAVDPARNCLHIYTVLLKFWHRTDFGAAMDRLPLT